MSSRQLYARNLAAAFLAGSWSRRNLRARGVQAIGQRAKWLTALVQRVVTAFGEPPVALTEAALARFIEQDAGFTHAWRNRAPDLPPHRHFWAVPAMMPAPGPPSSWSIPDLPTTTRLAEWLQVSLRDLSWLANARRDNGHNPPGPLHHYTYRWMIGPSGKRRLLEMPKHRLKAIQRRILHDILDHLPLHEAAHAYRRGRSIASFVAPHAGQRFVLRLDLRDFFPAVRSSRVHALFATVGYPASVARMLTGLCTNIVPAAVWRDASAPTLIEARQAQELFRAAHLPQGAPTSPTLANLCAYRLDCRLAGLAQEAGACYTRYADDLAFSGGTEFERSARRFHVEACCVALEEGFTVHTRKTRFMRSGVRQQLAGIVVNAHPNWQRPTFDRLKAILFNCTRHGPQSQNRSGRDDFRAYLAGQLAYLEMVNPARARKLRTLFDRIVWPPTAGCP